MADFLTQCVRVKTGKVKVSDKQAQKFWTHANIDTVRAKARKVKMGRTSEHQGLENLEASSVEHNKRSSEDLKLR